MMGTRTPCLSNSSTMRGTAAAASSLLTVIRTSSDPARANAAHCCTVEGMSAVSVLVIDCTTTGASEPTRTPSTTAVTAFLRGIVVMGASILAWGERSELVERVQNVISPRVRCATPSGSVAALLHLACGISVASQASDDIRDGRPNCPKVYGRGSFREESDLRPAVIRHRKQVSPGRADVVLFSRP